MPKDIRTHRTDSTKRADRTSEREERGEKARTDTHPAMTHRRTTSSRRARATEHARERAHGRKSERTESPMRAQPSRRGRRACHTDTPTRHELTPPRGHAEQRGWTWPGPAHNPLAQAEACISARAHIGRVGEGTGSGVAGLRGALRGDLDLTEGGPPTQIHDTAPHARSHMLSTRLAATRRAVALRE